MSVLLISWNCQVSTISLKLAIGHRNMRKTFQLFTVFRRFPSPNTTLKAAVFLVAIAALYVPMSVCLSVRWSTTSFKKCSKVIKHLTWLRYVYRSSIRKIVAYQQFNLVFSCKNSSECVYICWSAAKQCSLISSIVLLQLAKWEKL